MFLKYGLQLEQNGLTGFVQFHLFGIDSEDFKLSEKGNFAISKINYISKLEMDTAIVVDLPEYYSINEGIGLSKIGYRPIPIFNGTDEQPGSRATVNNHFVEIALIWGAKEIEKIKLSNSAPPAFLLDTNRMNRYKVDISVFDNSWDIYPQDIPSAEYFIKNGINKIVIRSNEKIQQDLNKILYSYQEKGIKILFTKGFEEPKEVKSKKIKENKH